MIKNVVISSLLHGNYFALHLISKLITIFFGYKTRVFFSLPKQSVLKDRSRSLELFREGKTCIVQNFTGMI